MSTMPISFGVPTYAAPLPSSAPAAPAAPTPTADPTLSPKDAVAIERKELMKALAVPAVVCTAVGGIGGAAMGFSGGVVGAIAGLAMSGAGAVVGAALGGYIGLEAGMKFFGKYDLLGVLATMVTTSAGVVLGGYAGFYGGAALGAMAAAGGGVLGAVVGGIGVGTLTGAVGTLGVAVHEVTTHPDRYPELNKEFNKKP